MGRKLAVAKVEQFWFWWKAGFPVAECARRAGFSCTAGSRLVRRAGVSAPMGRPLKDPAATARAVELLKAGVGPSQAATITGTNQDTAYRLARRLRDGTGVAPPLGRMVCEPTGVMIDTAAPRGARLGLAERQEIALGRARGEPLTVIAGRIGRPVCTVSREIARNKDPDGSYRIIAAEEAAQMRARRPKPAKLAQQGRLRAYVVKQLNAKRSPEQIAARIRLEHPDDPEMRVCHETIYQAFYLEARGGLKHVVKQPMRQGKTQREPHRRDGERRGRIPGMTSIHERPPEADDRMVPGHWEGDLIVGKQSASAVATLVERSFRYIMLGHLDGDHTADTVRDAIVPLLAGLPEQLRKTLTWDQGSEMACHFEIAEQAHIGMYFADAHSPWQRGTNENTNGLLRQYLPKGTDLSIYTPADLQAIADELNDRPRKTLGWLTPAEAFHLFLGHTVTIGGRPAKLPDSLQPLAQHCDDP